MLQAPSPTRPHRTCRGLQGTTQHLRTPLLLLLGRTTQPQLRILLQCGACSQHQQQGVVMLSRRASQLCRVLACSAGRLHQPLLRLLDPKVCQLRSLPLPGACSLRQQPVLSRTAPQLRGLLDWSTGSVCQPLVLLLGRSACQPCSLLQCSACSLRQPLLLVMNMGGLSGCSTGSVCHLLVLVLLLGERASHLPAWLGCSAGRLCQLLLLAWRACRRLLLQQLLTGLWCSACQALQPLLLLRVALAALLG